MSETNKAIVRQYFARWGTPEAANQSLAARLYGAHAGRPRVAAS